MKNKQKSLVLRPVMVALICFFGLLGSQAQPVYSQGVPGAGETGGGGPGPVDVDGPLNGPLNDPFGDPVGGSGGPSINTTPEGVGGCATCGSVPLHIRALCPPADALMQNRQPVLPSNPTATGCSTCATGSETMASDNAFMLSQSHFGGMQDARNSHGPAMFGNYDYTLTFYRVDSGVGTQHLYKAIVMDPCRGTMETFENDGTSTFSQDEGKGFRPFVLTNVGGTALSNAEMEDLTNAVAILIRKEDGLRFKFTAKNVSSENDGADADFFDSQLTTITSPQANEINFEYLTDVRNDPSYPGDQESQLRIATITDNYGVVATPTYAFVGGSWVWDFLNVAGYDASGAITIDYSYASSKLETVDRDGANVVTYSYGVAPEFGTGATTMTYESKLVWGPDRKSTIVYSGAYQGSGNATQNQYEGFVLGRKDASGFTYSTITPDASDANLYTIEYRDQTLTLVPGQSLQYGDETTFPSVPPGGDIGGGIVFGGIPGETTDITGYLTAHEYDECGNLIKTWHQKDTSDESYELMLYDDNNLLVYQRDREGYVKVTERDAEGRVLRVITGVKDNNDAVDDEGFTVPAGAQPLQTIYGYVPSGSNGEGQVAWMAENAYSTSEQIPPLNERTDYVYDSNNRLEKMILPLPAGQTSRPEVDYDWDGAYLVSTIDERDYETAYLYDSLGRLISTDYGGGAGGSAQVWYRDSLRRLYRKDRTGTVSLTIFDTAWRPQYEYSAFKKTNTLIGATNEVGWTNIPVPMRLWTRFTYLGGQIQPRSELKNEGRRTLNYYDYRGRNYKTVRYPRNGAYRLTEDTYQNNLLFSKRETYNSGPNTSYTRRVYRGYSADRQEVRQITTRTSATQFADNDAILAATRIPKNTLNRDYEINDVICLLYTSPSPRDRQKSRMPSSA